MFTENYKRYKEIADEVSDIEKSKLKYDVKEKKSEKNLQIACLLTFLGLFEISAITILYLTYTTETSELYTWFNVVVPIVTLFAVLELIDRIDKFKFSINPFKKISKFNKLVKRNKQSKNLNLELKNLETNLLSNLEKDKTLFNLIEDEKYKITFIKLTEDYCDLENEIEKSNNLYRNLKKIYKRGILKESLPNEVLLKEVLKKIKNINLSKSKFENSAKLLELLKLKNKISAYNSFISNILFLEDGESKNNAEELNELLNSILTDEFYSKLNELSELLSEITKKQKKLDTLNKEIVQSKNKALIDSIIKSKEYLEL